MIKLKSILYRTFLICIALSQSNCSNGGKVTTSETVKTAAVTGDGAELTSFIANELGKIMVLEYHLIGTPENEWRRTPDNFRKDLKLLYENNFYPISVHELATATFDIPAGKTPFVLTFDDSSAGQFRFITTNGKMEIDPDCAIGIMEEFKAKHHDFPLTASFYVLPAIKPTLRLFGQPEYQKQKLEWLTKHHYEIGNHGWFHVALNKLDDAGVQKHLAMFVKEIRAFLPSYEVKSLALPLGMHAKNRALEARGEFEGIKYRHEAVFLVGSATSVSPYSKDFNPLAIRRVQAGDTQTGPEAFMKRQDKHGNRFISDGDAKQLSFPVNLKPLLRKDLIKKYKLNLLPAQMLK